MNKAKQRVADRKKRAGRIRKKVSGTPERPRLSVRRSLKHMYAQISDDVNGKVLAQVSSTSKGVAERVGQESAQNKSTVAKVVGEIIAELGLQKGVESVIFDRKGYVYHGRVKALADAARGKGLKF
ncbi:MAG: 50S ribosomal protein L18 [Chitinivibrionales bacterium]|nr:50S ribosomal protein L18 [Chitinivibrionales bacterium]MBD3358120.1 50S ribosomal protein L18 [Chitinivibrionales bacterium]